MSIRLRYRISESSHCVYIDQFEDVRRVLGQPDVIGPLSSLLPSGQY